MRNWHVYTFIFALLSSVGTAHADGPWQGVWAHDGGRYNDLHLWQDGQRVYGTYAGKGMIEGRLSADGKELRATWDYVNSTRFGGVIWRLSPDEQAATGHWREGSLGAYTDGNWAMTKSSDAPTDDTYTQGPGPFWSDGFDTESDEFTRWINFFDQGGNLPDAGPEEWQILALPSQQPIGEITMFRKAGTIRGDGVIEAFPFDNRRRSLSLFKAREDTGPGLAVTMNEAGDPQNIEGTMDFGFFFSERTRFPATISFEGDALPQTTLAFRREIVATRDSPFGSRTFMVVDMPPERALALYAGPNSSGGFTGALPHDRKGIVVLECAASNLRNIDLEPMTDLTPALIFVNLRTSFCKVSSEGVVGWASAQHLMRE